jgi:pyridinium-3,5-bisthiocarboxylic acid mononucleotide nickel chelatase
MKIAYLDCIGGISGDMLLGAFIDAGVDPKQLQLELEKLGLSGWRLEFRNVKKAGVAAVKVDVIDQSPAVERNLLDILKIIAGSGLSTRAKKAAAHVFETLATAEGAAHGQVPATVHFHEVGAVDAIIDVAGAAICLDLLGIDKLYVSTITASRAAPATTQILTGMSIAVYDVGIENVTPTGAAIARTLAEQPAALPPMTLQKLGYGAGEADTDQPNVVRVLIGEAPAEKAAGKADETILLLESNIDDLTPEALAYAMERLFGAGALDVWFTPVTMKKGRPAYVLSCLTELDHDGPIIDVFFRETGTLGIRIVNVNRLTLHRETITVTTEFGDLRIKKGWYGGGLVSVRPEFEDVAAAARKHGRPFKDVYDAAARHPASR